MAKKIFEIKIKKDSLKFASSHMTVFPDGTKEHLHGHHYQPTVSIQFRDASFDKMLAFSEVKKGMRKIAKLWDEKVLLATKNPHFKIIRHDDRSLEFTLCEKRYLLPSDEVILLNVDNITCEALADAYYEFLAMDLEWLRSPNQGPDIHAVSVFIEESPGQGASVTVQ